MNYLINQPFFCYAHWLWYLVFKSTKSFNSMDTSTTNKTWHLWVESKTTASHPSKFMLLTPTLSKDKQNPYNQNLQETIWIYNSTWKSTKDCDLPRKALKPRNSNSPSKPVQTHWYIKHTIYHLTCRPFIPFGKKKVKVYHTLKTSVSAT